MSGTVRTACERCGALEVAADDVTILPIIATIANIYRFRCPLCATWNAKDATPKIVGLLLRAGVRVAACDDDPAWRTTRPASPSGCT
jgi:hypothetical protein